MNTEYDHPENISLPMIYLMTAGWFLIAAGLGIYIAVATVLNWFKKIWLKLVG